MAINKHKGQNFDRVLPLPSVRSMGSHRSDLARSGAPFLLDAFQQDLPLGPWSVALPQLLLSVNEQSSQFLEMLVGS